MKIYDTEYVKKGWEYVISKIDKYFNSPIVNTDPSWEIREFVVNSKKNWVFDLLNKVICNQKEDYIGDYHPNTYKGSNQSHRYSIQNIEYIIRTKKYLNGNTLVIIQKKKI